MVITCDTDVSEIIKVSDADSYFSELESLMGRIEKKIETTLDSEMSSNGLSKAAFHIDNECLFPVRSVHEKFDCVPYQL